MSNILDAVTTEVVVIFGGGVRTVVSLEIVSVPSSNMAWTKTQRWFARIIVYL